jgi:hypothetical protein
MDIYPFGSLGSCEDSARVPCIGCGEMRVFKKWILDPLTLSRSMLTILSR